jgi:hypothetical protein
VRRVGQFKQCRLSGQEGGLAPDLILFCEQRLSDVAEFFKFLKWSSKTSFRASKYIDFDYFADREAVCSV